MRMRRKKRLEERIAACGGLIISMERADRNYTVKDDNDMLDIDGLFGRQAPLTLEIGCGKGRFITELALSQPEINFIAVEKSANVVVDAAEKAQRLGLKNVRFLKGSAEYLDCYIPQGSAERIYLNFSCPFPKKSYAAHRLTHRNFLAIYEKLLSAGGDIRQKTDNAGLFEFSLQEFSQCGWGLRNVSLDLHNSQIDNNIMTEYEEKFSSQGLPIYYLEAYKRG